MFFTRLGYKNLVLKADKKNFEVDVSGSFVKNGKDTKMQAKCNYSGKEEEDRIISFFKQKVEKLFYITLSEQSKKPNLKLLSNSSYINRSQFINYLVHFKLI
jgi:hypothetical protein